MTEFAIVRYTMCNFLFNKMNSYELGMIKTRNKIVLKKDFSC